MQTTKLETLWVVCLVLTPVLIGCPAESQSGPGNTNSTNQQRSITVTEPAEGASIAAYPAGSTLAIRWTSTGAIGKVRIELLYDANASADPGQAGSVDTVIADSTANDGTWDWVVPASFDLGPDRFIRVSDAEDTSVFGLSCEIVVGSLPPSTPDGPNPAEGAVDVPAESDLYWSDAARATSYDVYFGTSSPPPLVGDTHSSSWTPATLSHDTTYYWSIVATNSAGSTPGPVWSFMTQPDVPGAPGKPVPHDSDADVSVELELDWSDAARATSYDVYFGTSDPPPLAGNTSSSNWTLSALSHSTTYYWNIVATNSAGSTPGPVWSFTTQPDGPAAPDGPHPHDGAVGVAIKLDLDWNDAAGATTYDVYFGTTDPPPFVGNSSYSDWWLAPLSHNTTYYWKVVAINSTGSTPGHIWSFTTNPASAAGMVLIPAGEFQMGDVFGEGTTAEVPVHAVSLDAFYIDACEVTNQQYAAALNWALDHGLVTVSGGVVYQAGSGHDYPYCHTTSSSPVSRITWDGSSFGVVAGKQNHPMAVVSWHGAAAYCNWRSAMAGKPSCYNLSTWACDFGAPGYRLPTEAEWEKAARGGATGHRFPWSDEDTVQQNRANYWSSLSFPYDTNPTQGDSPLWGVPPYPYTSPVGFYTGALQYQEDWDWPGAPTSYQTANGANGYGLYDMAGGVWEWCNDWYSNPYYDVSPYENPHGPPSGSYRVMRGGSWDDSAYGCRVANRGLNEPDDPDIDDGFRCAATPP